MRAARLGLALTVAAASVAAAQIPAEPRPGRLVIDAVVQDKNGRPILDLRPEELEVWIAGYRAPIESLTLVAAGGGEEPQRRSVALVLDDITLDPATIPRAREVAKEILRRLAPADRMAIVTLSGTSVESTDQRAVLFQAIDRYGFRTTGVTRPDVLAAHVLQTIATVSRRLTETSDRSAIVAIGPSWLFDTPIPPPTSGNDLRPEWTDAMRAMALANVTLYVIDPGGVGMARVNGGTGGFARETGGFAFANTNDLNSAADRILRETASYYRLRVGNPPIGRNAELRDVDVRVLRRGLTVRARRAIPGSR